MPKALPMPNAAARLDLLGARGHFASRQRRFAAASRIDQSFQSLAAEHPSAGLLAFMPHCDNHPTAAIFMPRWRRNAAGL
jgi:hypothetical protein